MRLSVSGYIVSVYAHHMRWKISVWPRRVEEPIAPQSVNHVCRGHRLLLRPKAFASLTERNRGGALFLL